MSKGEKSLLNNEILVLLLVQVPVNYFFYILYQPYVIRPWTNIVYFLALSLIGYFLAKKYGSLSYRYVEGRSSSITLIWATAAMFICYLILKYRFVILDSIPFLAAMENIEKGRWQFFTKSWNEINIFISVSGIFLVVVAMELFYRAYIQELLSKHMNMKNAIICMALLSGLHSGVLGPASGLVDFLLALIWGWVYYKSGLYGAIFVHMVWDILFIYFPGN